MEAVASSLYLTERNRRGKTRKERRERKSTEGEDGTSKKGKPSCSHKERCFQGNTIWKPFERSCQSCVELYLALRFFFLSFLDRQTIKSKKQIKYIIQSFTLM